MSLSRTLLSVSVCAGLGGCFVPVDSDWPTWTWNWDPVVYDGDAGCVWDARRAEHVWYFEAEVDDWDGFGDVVLVEARVYDDWRGGDLVDVFELAPTDEPWVWYGEWSERRTALDCWYGGYGVDFVVWDSFDASDVLTVRPRTL